MEELKINTNPNRNRKSLTMEELKINPNPNRKSLIMEELKLTLTLTITVNLLLWKN